MGKFVSKRFLNYIGACSSSQSQLEMTRGFGGNLLDLPVSLEATIATYSKGFIVDGIRKTLTKLCVTGQLNEAAAIRLLNRFNLPLAKGGLLNTGKRRSGTYVALMLSSHIPTSDSVTLRRLEVLVRELEKLGIDLRQLGAKK